MIKSKELLMLEEEGTECLEQILEALTVFYDIKVRMLELEKDDAIDNS